MALPTPQQQAIAARLVEAAVAYFPGVTADDVFGRCRSQEAVACRAAVAYTLYQSGWIMVDIGRALDRDHSTIYHLVRRHHQGRYRKVMVTMPDTVSPPLDIAQAIDRIIGLEATVADLGRRLAALERDSVITRGRRAS